jgi:SAM-dependent methyltransferase
MEWRRAVLGEAPRNHPSDVFFPSPLEGIREMLRVLKPGRKLALAVWDTADKNPFFHTVSRAMDRYVDPPQREPDAPDAFRFASPGKLQEVLEEAGVVATSERLLHFAIQAPVSVEDFWALRLEISEQLREKAAMLSTEQLAEVKHDALEAFGEYFIGSGMSFPSHVLIVSGTKSTRRS